MKSYIKVIFLLGIVLFIASCSISQKEINEFQDKYGVQNTLVHKMSYNEFLEFTEEKTGVVFLGNESSEAKDLAKIFCDTLCECDVNKAHFVDTDEITDTELLDKFNVKKLNYPIIVAYKMGKLVVYYDTSSNPDNLKQYIDDLIHEAYPTVCTDAC